MPGDPRSDEHDAATFHACLMLADTVRVFLLQTGSLASLPLGRRPMLGDLPPAFVRWDRGGGMWVTADEIAEVLSDGR